MLTTEIYAGDPPARHRRFAVLLLAFVSVLVAAPVGASSSQPRVLTVVRGRSTIPSRLRSPAPVTPADSVQQPRPAGRLGRGCVAFKPGQAYRDHRNRSCGSWQLRAVPGGSGYSSSEDSDDNKQVQTMIALDDGPFQLCQLALCLALVSNAATQRFEYRQAPVEDVVDVLE